MFETVAPEIAGRRSRLILYESLPVSLAVHGVAIAIAVVIAWNVHFPSQSPRFHAVVSARPDPDPPPPPPPPAPPRLTPVIPKDSCRSSFRIRMKQ